MKLVIGGAYQGQLEYAREKYPQVKFLDGAVCTMEELLTGEGVYDFQEFIRREMKAERDVTFLGEKLIEANPSLIIVSNEVGYGVVPVDSFMRAYREAVGRISTKLAAASDQVVRVVCGIGTVIKNA